LIHEIRDRFHKDAIGKPVKERKSCDVLIVAHGHILRAFAARWINKNIAENPSLLLEAGGVGTLRYRLLRLCVQPIFMLNNSSYEHHNITEPALILGGAFTVPEAS
jgi:broad specificity phosphatase PhoE